MRAVALATRLRRLGAVVPKSAVLNDLLTRAFATLDAWLLHFNRSPTSRRLAIEAPLYQTIVVEILRSLVRTAARRFDAPEAHLDGQLFANFTSEFDTDVEGWLGEVLDRGGDWPDFEPEELGQLYEALIGFELIQTENSGLTLGRSQSRKKTGAFFTPTALAGTVVGHALRLLPQDDPRRLRICDPAMGGGMFLLQTARQLLEGCVRADPSRVPLAHTRSLIAVGCIYGVDRSELAVAVSEAALWLWAADSSRRMSLLGKNLQVGDALIGQGWSDTKLKVPEGCRSFDWHHAMPEVKLKGFDCVLGNPPWVAFAGRSAVPLVPATRAWLSGNYRAFRGYPTLQALFVERAAELAPRGVIALLVPSPLADLDGYRGARQVLTAAHAPVFPLIEFGQDAFEGVTQPCFALVARPVVGPAVATSTPWLLSERQRAGLNASVVEVPAVLERLRQWPSWPAALFGEMGFQTTRLATQNLLVRGPQPTHDELCPLLEGKDIREFHQGVARLYLRAGPDLLRAAGCRLRSREQYRGVKFVVRQTAKVPIAALHSSGLPFRNSLLAGFEVAGLSAHVMLGLLNSGLYRALHLAFQRDARQAAFPQVKVAHLRSLPMPPQAPEVLARIERLARAAEQAEGKVQRAELDTCVFDLFELTPDERTSILKFLGERAPELGYAPR